MKPRTIQAFIALFIFYSICDFTWHNVLLLNFYETRFNAINGETVAAGLPIFIILFEVMAAAIGVYFIGKTSKSIRDGMFNGGLLGLLVSGGINFISHSLIPKWDVTMLAVDTIWGIVMGAIGGAIVMWIWNRK